MQTRAKPFFLKIMNVLITGAASGIGKATRDLFLRQGHSVFSIDVKPIEAKEGLCPFTADITDEEALLSVFEALRQKQVRFQAIVNLAGVHDMLSFAETDTGRFRRLINVNLMGPICVNKVFHPLLDEKGRVVLITSEVACLDPMPFNGGYTVTKTALDCYAQALRQELNLLGQKVITVRPGAVKTELCLSSISATQRLADETVLYKKQAARFVRIAKRFMGTPAAPEKIAKLIYRASTVRRPRLLYKKHLNPGLILMNLLPKRAQLRLIKTILR